MFYLSKCLYICDPCNEEDLYVCKGWESSLAVRCKKCTQYFYYAFDNGPACTGIFESDGCEKLEKIANKLFKQHPSSASSQESE